MATTADCCDGPLAEQESPTDGGLRDGRQVAPRLARFPDSQLFARRFYALGDEIRLDVLALLRGGERCVCELTAHLALAQPRLSFHLKVLKDAGLISHRRQGRWSYYALDAEALREIEAFLRRVPPPADPCCQALGTHSPIVSRTQKGAAMNVDDSLKSLVQEKYGRAAAEVRDGGAAASCCGPSTSGCGCGSGSDPITSNLYDSEETAALPPEALRASLGCGNPTALAELRPGEVVLDLGSGGGIDVLLSARRVGPSGKAYGLDMTDEMLALARDNQRRAGVENVEFLRGEIEAIPLPDASVDVIISNCVINLSGDKRRVLSEAFRVLRPGGRFAVSDVVVRGSLPTALRRNMELWVGCVAGALEEAEFKGLLADIGFENPEIEPTRIYQLEDAREFLASAGLDADELASQVDGRIMGAFVRASKPATAPGP